MVWLQSMPGRPFSGPLPSLSEHQLDLASRLRAHVRHLAEQIGPRNLQHYAGLEQARAYLAGQLRQFGYSVRELEYRVDGRVFANLETLSDSPHLVIGAHYDSVFDCPGANDNASGVAGVLELARLLQRHARTLRFVLFTNEEPPFYKTPDMGSVRYVQQTPREAVRGMLCLETVGSYELPQNSPVPGLLPAWGDFVALVGNAASVELVRELVGAWQQRVAFPCLGLVPTPEAEPLLMQAGIAMSDHASFWDAGIPAAMVTDTVFYRYPHYHQLSDTWEKLNYESFARMIEGLAAVFS